MQAKNFHTYLNTWHYFIFNTYKNTGYKLYIINAIKKINITHHVKWTAIHKYLLLLLFCQVLKNKILNTSCIK